MFLQSAVKHKIRRDVYNLRGQFVQFKPIWSFFVIFYFFISFPLNIRAVTTCKRLKRSVFLPQLKRSARCCRFPCEVRRTELRTHREVEKKLEKTDPLSCLFVSATASTKGNKRSRTRTDSSTAGQSVGESAAQTVRAPFFSPALMILRTCF